VAIPGRHQQSYDFLSEPDDFYDQHDFRYNNQWYDNNNANDFGPDVE
jgi:hypothetical protein